MKITTKYQTELPNGQVLTADSINQLEKMYDEETNQKPEQQNITIEFPVVLEADDYHEFRSHQKLLEKLTKKEISYRELGYGDNGYSAVFWIGKVEPVQLIEVFMGS